MLSEYLFKCVNLRGYQLLQFERDILDKDNKTHLRQRRDETNFLSPLLEFDHTPREICILFFFN